MPNSTAFTQEMDSNYGPFNTLFCQVLDQVVHQQITRKVYVFLLPTLSGLIVFVGINTETGYKIKESAF